MYHRLITEFDRLTDTPVVLNTSFNDSEPIVCTPSDALSTFARTRFGALVMGNFVVQRSV
jgi:carbamoyltransferase